MTRSLNELRNLNPDKMPDDDHLFRGKDISRDEFDEWMEAMSKSTKGFEKQKMNNIDVGQATIDALNSLTEKPE